MELRLGFSVKFINIPLFQILQDYYLNIIRQLCLFLIVTFYLQTGRGNSGLWGVRLDDSGNVKNDDRLSKAVKDCDKLMAEIKYGVNMQNLKMRLFSA